MWVVALETVVRQLILCRISLRCLIDGREVALFEAELEEGFRGREVLMYCVDRPFDQVL
jgi:hypothetical protein